VRTYYQVLLPCPLSIADDEEPITVSQNNVAPVGSPAVAPVQAANGTPMHAQANGNCVRASASSGQGVNGNGKGATA
jgi:hypothetical protein